MTLRRPGVDRISFLMISGRVLFIRPDFFGEAGREPKELVAWNLLVARKMRWRWSVEVWPFFEFEDRFSSNWVKSMRADAASIDAK
jgi:hypothetical protein